MTIPRNKGIRTRDFKVRLSVWLRLPELNDMRKQQGGSKQYGKGFIIKAKYIKAHDRKVKRYAIFIRERRKEKRTEPVMPINLAGYFLRKLRDKKEGISLLREAI